MSKYRSLLPVHKIMNKIQIQHLPSCRGIPMMSPAPARPGGAGPVAGVHMYSTVCTVQVYSRDKWCSVFASL